MRFPQVFRAVSLFLVLQMTSQAAVQVNGIAAIANGRPVTKREVAFMAAPLQRQLMARYPRRGPAYRAELKKVYDKVLEELIDRELIMFEFKEKMTGSIPDTAVESTIDREIQTLYNGSRVKFREMLNETRMTLAKYEELTREKLIVQAMRSRHFDQAAPPTPDEVRAEYNREKSNYRDRTKDKVQFEKIFIPKQLPDQITTPEEQLRFTEGLMAQIKNGANFAELAKAHSADAFAEDGGLSDLLPRTDLSPVFASIIFGEKIGSLIGPLEDGGGYTIVRVTKIKEATAPPLSKLRKDMEQAVQRSKNSKRYDRWIAGVRKRALIKRKM